MLPPDSTATTGGLNSRGSAMIAATVAAPAGSTTSFARSSSSSIARLSWFSDTVTTSSTSSRMCAKVSAVGSPTAMPSARVDIWCSRTGRPSDSERGQAAACSACTPTSRTSGRFSRT